MSSFEVDDQDMASTYRGPKLEIRPSTQWTADNFDLWLVDDLHSRRSARRSGRDKRQRSALLGQAPAFLGVRIRSVFGGSRGCRTGYSRGRSRSCT
jgi:hypothetical protein